MQYTIKEVSEKLNLSISTIRYYDKKGLLPFLERKNSGYRIFNDADIELLKIIKCLKNTGMSLKDIYKYINYLKMGDSSLEERYKMFEERRKVINEQINELKKSLELIEYKCGYYQTALKTIHKTNFSN